MRQAIDLNSLCNDEGGISIICDCDVIEADGGTRTASITGAYVALSLAIKKLMKDPWGNEYRYVYPGSNGEYDVFSLGADNAVGGEGEAADVGNWNLDE